MSSKTITISYETNFIIINIGLKNISLFCNSTVYFKTMFAMFDNVTGRIPTFAKMLTVVPAPKSGERPPPFPLPGAATAANEMYQFLEHQLMAYRVSNLEI